MSRSFLITTLVMFTALLNACTPAVQMATNTPTLMASATITPTATALPSATPTAQPQLADFSLHVAADLPERFQESLSLPPALKQVTDAAQADLRLDVLAEAETSDFSANWVYALVAPFPTVEDGVTLKDLQSFWTSGQNGLFGQGSLLVSPETRVVFEKLWGPADEKAVQNIDAAQLLDTAWAERPAWALVPFEALEPRWKVLRVDEVSPLDKDFDAAAYGLTVRLGISGTPTALEALKRETDTPLFTTGNRNAEHLTSLMLTGTTAMVRYMAERMEENGVLYPATDIKKVFDSVDIVHISNEVPFYEQCPPAKPVRREMRFCSDPKYFELLQDIGMDVVELTGNHILDWGVDPLLYTIDLYDQNGIKYYGGGCNESDARKALIVEDHGNRLGFIGCSPAGPTSVWATDTQPGSAKCDFDYIQTQIQAMLADGVIPVFTFQHYESDDYRPTPMQRPGDFHMVSEMGAAIVSGSQSHFPQAMTFDGQGFIHYGLGNTFFDQMDDYHRMAFIDRHVFYEGRYISTELKTIILEDYARPREMTTEERQKFLQTVFAASDWEIAENK